MIKIGSEYKYRLTRMCLNNGLLSLPATMRGLFPEEGNAIAKDLESGIEYRLTMLSPNKVSGFRDFLNQHHLQVNDFIVIRLDEDGSYILSPQASRKSSRKQSSVNINKILDEIYSSGVSYSEEEIRHSYSLPVSINIAKNLAADRRFMLKAGRWQRTIEEEKEESDYNIKVVNVGKPKEQKIVRGEAKKRAYKSETLGEETLSRQNKLKSFLRSVGYDVNVLSASRLLAKINFGRRSYSVLLTILTKGSEISWSEMIEQRRLNHANYSAVVGEHADLLRLTPYAETGKVSLWSWQGIDRLIANSETVSFSPFDLEPYFAKDGLFEEGLEKYQRQIDEAIESKGKLSSVLRRLARVKPYSAFMLDELQVDGCNRKEVLQILALLEQDPFRLIQKIADGEFLLRQPVRASLAGVADYAGSLRSHLPSKKSDRIEIHSDELVEDYYAQ